MKEGDITTMGGMTIAFIEGSTINPHETEGYYTPPWMNTHHLPTIFNFLHFTKKPNLFRVKEGVLLRSGI